MKIEEEKKLVAEKLMGWRYFEATTADSIVMYPATWERPNDGEYVDDHKWNPQSERKWWDEIWDKMGADLFHAYIKNYDEIPQSPIERTWRIHTAKPDVCWQALIKTLEVKNGN